MTIKQVFFNQFERLRSGWRFMIFLAVFIFISAVVGSAAKTFFGLIFPGYATGSAGFLVVNGLLSLIAALFIGWLCGKYLEGLPFRALGAWFTKGWLRNLGVGIVVGSATLGLAVLFALISGGLSFRLNSGQQNTAIFLTLGFSLVVFAVAAAFEETFFRGYMLQTFSRSGLAWLAILLTSIFFGIVHLNNPNAGQISTINTILAGIWFGVAYLKTRDLWFVFGMHLMWNWTQGAIFGIEVSGLTDITTPALLEEIDRGPSWITGENYGIEGGIACTIALIISTALIYFLPFLKPSHEMLLLTSAETESEL
ncbi:MAG: CPBP family intramembrane glutamic endopeptidase [Pyrinomonadaceae bacterium]|nr:CPBP family intramembrane metalloprotease [Blastocatellia bacterium]MDQ3221279.1 CPBP family intramembrane metalloprotease [Acidobacteriota bacterium]MDQ3490919.1 CPBP family intramembrane metalloprotease [Acidobacteriota bacterium]